MQEKDHNSFEKNSFLLFTLMMLANACNYLFQIFTGHLLSVEEYAVENTLLSLYGVLGIPNTIIALVSAHYLAKENVSSHGRISSVCKRLLHLAVLVSIAILMAGMLSAGYITQVFGIQNEFYIRYVVLLSVVAVLYHTIYGILQGLQEFKTIGIQGFLASFGKLLLSCVLVLAGWKIDGVLTGILIGTVVSIFYGARIVRIKISASSKNEITDAGNQTLLELLDFVKYMCGAIISQGAVIAFTNGDILLVKYYFTETETGIYSSAMVIGKIAMYVSSAVIATLFPMVVELSAKGKDTRPILKKAFLYGGGICMLCSLGMVFLGKFVIGILFGEKYLQAIVYLPFVCMFIVPLTFVTILMNYLLALGRVKVFAISMLLAIALCILLTGLYHETVGEVMLICGGVLSSIFIVNMGYAFHRIC